MVIQRMDVCTLYMGSLQPGQRHRQRQEIAPAPVANDLHQAKVKGRVQYPDLVQALLSYAPLARDALCETGHKRSLAPLMRYARRHQRLAARSCPANGASQVKITRLRTASRLR